MGDQDDLVQCEERVKEALKTGNAALIAEKVKEYLDKKDNIPMNIAVTGESGSGKSTFVNVFRGVDNRDENAAPTGVVEITTEVEGYNHPKYPNVTLWDLPGIGTTRFPADKYLEHVGFKKFDFFIIVSDTRFRENDAKLAQEIQKMGKKFYFVRNKIDNDLRSEERSQRDFNQENTLDRIRKDCIKGLEELHIQSPKVFLISSFDLHLYEFERLCNTLEKELPQHQKDVLLFALPNISQEICKKKKEALQENIKCLPLTSADGAAVQVPGSSIAIDGGLILRFVTMCQDVFNVNAVELCRSLLNEPVVVKLTVDLILRVLSSCGVFTSFTAADEGSGYFSIFGILIAIIMYFLITHKGLSFFLDNFAEAALKAMMKKIKRTEV